MYDNRPRHLNSGPRDLDRVIGRWSGLIGSRYLADRNGAARHLVAPPSREPSIPLSFTVHLRFGAVSLERARDQAVQYAEALSIVRPEIAIGGTRLSYADAWHLAERLFCGAAGPHGETCADVRGHAGSHHADGLGGPAWADTDNGGGQV